MLTRPQTYTGHGHREEQEQRLCPGAGHDGRLVALRHEKLSIASLNAIGVGVILHVGIGRRWPFGRPARANDSAVEPAEQGLRRA